ncbi:MAG: TetR/AcrR family transcriptional regulator [Actinobacteria bacterium]|nr:TetR/AcrR family transcriptional regulator [Actinomycetota bacterium]
MRKRAEQIDETRRRIVEAAVRLHGELGPAGTTISGIAEAAGVTRVTVYRHFPDDAALFAACSAHWSSMQQGPDPDRWASVADPVERLRTGLADLYRFYREGEGMLTGVYRDRATLPEPVRQALDDDHRQFRRLLLDPFCLAGATRRRVRGLIGHAVSFWTWRSLCVDEGLSNRAAVDAMSALILEAAGHGDPAGARS